MMSALTEHRPTSDEARAIVRAVRRDRRIADGELFVTGPTAMDLDSARYLRERAPTAIAYVVVMTALILFLLLGSVVLPLKAVAMNTLSITASFGALVWIFQKGHLAGLLHFTPGPVEPSLPIVMFCAVFGLSMDYEVLLLTRMQEEYVRTGDNERAVAEGLARSARLITSAAAIMVVVFAAFTMAELRAAQGHRARDGHRRGARRDARAGARRARHNAPLRRSQLVGARGAREALEEVAARRRALRSGARIAARVCARARPRRDGIFTPHRFRYDG